MDERSKKQYLLLTIASVISSFLQTAGVAAISLFFSLLLGGTLPPSVQALIGDASISTLGILVLASTLAGTISSGLTTYYGIKICWQQYEQIACRLLSQYLAAPYEWHMERNSSDLGNIVLNEARNLVLWLLQQVVMIVVRACELVLLSMLLFAAKPLVAITSFLSFGATYFILFKLNRGAILRMGDIVARTNSERQQIVTESLNGIKAVKIAQNASFFERRFQHSAHEFAESTAKIQAFSIMPKFFIEAILFSGVVGFVVVSQLRGWALYETVPLLALYGAAAIRMLPAAQQLYASVSIMLSARPVLDKLLQDLSSEVESAKPTQVSRHDHSVNAPFLTLSDVGYRYPSASKPSLSKVSLSIQSGEKLGLVGTTGAGKTTLVDVILGLLPPTTGSLTVTSDTDLSSLVSYVPQEIHFIDDTIAANIAWGLTPDERDFDKIVKAAHKAQIHDHITGLPQSYDTPMGEQGVRLSGGQKQRIGLARALYKDPSILVLDEASNALDPETERQILETLLSQDLTLIVIAHRLSILRNCDRLLVMQDGEISAQGTYQELIETNDFFRGLAAADLGQTPVGHS